MSKFNRFTITVGTLMGIASLLALTTMAGAAIASDQSPRSNVIGPNIIGGHKASETYEGMASLQIDHNGDPNWQLCDASLVFHTFAVTNAHCVTNDDGSPKDPGLFHLRIGSANRLVGGEVASVTKILVHADWCWACHADTPSIPVADVALLRLNTYVQEQPFEIADHLGGPRTVTRLLGWGVTEPSGVGDVPTALQELDTTIIAAGACASAFISVGEFCTANPHGTDGPCFGDSGGPALQRVGSPRWSLVGGASRAQGPYCGVHPTVHTDMAFYRSWAYDVARYGVVPPPSGGKTHGPPGRGSTTRMNNTLSWTKTG